MKVLNLLALMIVMLTLAIVNAQQQMDLKPPPTPGFNGRPSDYVYTSPPPLTTNTFPPKSPPSSTTTTTPPPSGRGIPKPPTTTN
ncbi:UNKNOWN [Stylonychia lemnae]|uniref:Uncharacterized protein n=1 Tax=Stylonychia lemnae TaxID=5949 RepID=A0A077ZQ94_STYLE|nr:UNKNOWN [Stylonychia lemnae]|eukprot:CDW71629.1 UNKNOWN [Stylonychia lemnae]